MIKLSGTSKAGRPVIILGIDAENVKRLKAGSPIHVHADQLGFAGDIVIHYEETAEKLTAAFSSLIGEHTRV